MGRMSEIAMEQEAADFFAKRLLQLQLTTSRLVEDCKFLIEAGIIQDEAADTLRASIERIERDILCER